jgi:TM2 domain-containing membrane protein YozV
MSDIGEPTRADILTKVRELLGCATLARARNQREQALKLVHEAIALDDTNAEAHELKGDLLLDLKRGEEAMASFRRAMELHPDRRVLEDKVARAALQRAARRQTLEMSQAILEGRAKPAGPKKSPAYAALLSLIAPGLGQFYNGEVLKGFAMLIGYVFLSALVVLAVLREIASSPIGAQAMYGRPIDTGAITSALSGSALLVLILLMVLYIYSVADAAIRAGRTMTSDESGLV